MIKRHGLHWQPEEVFAVDRTSLPCLTIHVSLAHQEMEEQASDQAVDVAVTPPIRGQAPLKPALLQPAKMGTPLVQTKIHVSAIQVNLLPCLQYALHATQYWTPMESLCRQVNADAMIKRLGLHWQPEEAYVADRTSLPCLMALASVAHQEMEEQASDRALDAAVMILICGQETPKLALLLFV